MSLGGCVCALGPLILDILPRKDGGFTGHGRVSMADVHSRSGSIDDPSFDWVGVRSRCSIGVVYSELCDLVRRDVERLNSLPNCCSIADEGPFASSSRDEEFRIFNGGRFLLAVERAGSSGDLRTVDFRSRPSKGGGTELFVGLEGEEPFFDVTVEWNYREGRRDIFMDGERVHLWQISERAFSRAFFDDD